MEWMKEKASNVMASSNAGAEKTKAVVDEKKDKMMGNQVDKNLATQRKEERMAEAEARKQEAVAHNAQQKQANTNTGGTGTGYGTGTNTNTGGTGTGYGTRTGTGHSTNSVL